MAPLCFVRLEDFYVRLFFSFVRPLEEHISVQTKETGRTNETGSLLKTVKIIAGVEHTTYRRGFIGVATQPDKMMCSKVKLFFL